MNKYIKYISFVMLGMMVSSSVMAYDSCVGGTEIMANSSCIVDGVEYCNGRTFCKSNAKLYWWTAVLWCRANGGTLVSPESACPNTIDGQYCRNLGSSNWIWTNKLAANGNAYGIDGGGYWRPLSRIDPNHQALCE